MNMTKNKNEESFGRFDFVGKVGLFGGISLLLVVLSFVYLLVHGVSYGIDFAGG
jgi:preprotein translocase subunit SecF